MKHFFYLFIFLLSACQQVQPEAPELKAGIGKMKTLDNVQQLASPTTFILPAENDSASNPDQEARMDSSLSSNKKSYSELDDKNKFNLDQDKNTTEQEDFLKKEKKSAEEVVAQKNAYYIELNPDPEFDNTASLQAQLDAIPDGKATGNTDILKVVGEGNEWGFEILEPEIQYVNIYLPKGKFWTEGGSWKGIDPNNSKKTEGSYVTLLRGRKYLKIHGEGTTFYTKRPGIKQEGGNIWKGIYSHRRHFAIWDSQNIIINGLRIEGSNYTEGLKLYNNPELTPDFWTAQHKGNGSLPGYPAYTNYWEFEHGFDGRRSKNITLNNVSVYAVWGDGIYLSESHNVIIKDAKVKFNGRMSFATNGGSNILIDGFYANYSRMSGIDFENDHPDSVIEYVEVKNSVFDKIQLIGIPAEGTGVVSNINVHNNDLGYTSVSIRSNDPELHPIRRNWRINDNKNLGMVKAVWIDNLQINRNIIDNKEAWVIKPSAIRNFEATGNTFVRGNGIRTAMSGAAGFEPYSLEKWIVKDNIPPAKIFDESEASTEAGKIQYEQMKAGNSTID